MPGDNCCIPLCGSSRRTKGLGIFKLPSTSKTYRQEWRKKWLDAILKTRELVYADMKSQLEADRLFTCEKHFHPHEIDIFVNTKMTKKKLIPEAIPTLQMPKKSHTTETVTRPSRTVVKDVQVKQNHACYKTLPEIVQRTKNLMALSTWNTTMLDTKLILKKISECYNTTLPEFTLTVDDGLGFTIQVYDCFLPEDHYIYKTYRRSMKNITVSDLVKILENYIICPGINYFKDDSSIYCHVVPLINDDTDANENENVALVSYKSKQFVRSVKCSVLSQEKCEHCKKSEKDFFHIDNKKSMHLATPAKLKAPITKTDRQRV